MKSLIQKLLRESLEAKLLDERLMDLNDDVDLIYNLFYKDGIDEINRTGIITKDTFKSGTFSTNKLVSPLAKKATEINDCDMNINLQSGNYYKPSEYFINLSIMGVANLVINHYGGDLNKTIEDIDEEDVEQFKNEFTEHRIKGTIHHELSHWVDDTLHNRHIAQKLKVANDTGISPSKGKDINTHYIEIQAQIHSIIQLKRKFEDKWDYMTFDDLINYSPSLRTVYKRLPYEDRLDWIKRLKIRMHREGLLGKNMVN